MTTLVWRDNGAGSTARVPDHPDPEARYYVVGGTWWFHPSWMKPVFVEDWNGTLDQAKAACQADYDLPLASRAWST